MRFAVRNVRTVFCESGPLGFDGRSVGEHFGNPRADLVRIVPGADDRVGADLGGVLEHQVERVASRLLAQLRVQSDVAADDGLQAGADVAEQASRANRDATDNAKT